MTSHSRKRQRGSQASCDSSEVLKTVFRGRMVLLQHPMKYSEIDYNEKRAGSRKDVHITQSKLVDGSSLDNQLTFGIQWDFGY